MLNYQPTYLYKGHMDPSFGTKITCVRVRGGEIDREEGGGGGRGGMHPLKWHRSKTFQTFKVPWTLYFVHIYIQGLS